MDQVGESCSHQKEEEQNMKVLKEGWVERKGYFPDSYCKCWLVFYERQLAYYHKNDKTASPQGSIRLDNVTVEIADHSGCLIAIKDRDDNDILLAFRVESEDLMHEWYTTIHVSLEICNALDRMELLPVSDEALCNLEIKNELMIEQMSKVHDTVLQLFKDDQTMSDEAEEACFTEGTKFLKSIEQTQIAYIDMSTLARKDFYQKIISLYGKKDCSCSRCKMGDK